MKSIYVLFGVLLIFTSVAASSEPLFSETIEINNADDQFNFDFTAPVYVKRGSTYEIENRMLSIEVGPKDWSRPPEGTTGQDYKGFFLKIYVSIEISNTKGKILKDFKSYLNYELENCDTASGKGRLFWDHAGEERADLAGETFEDTPLIVGDECIEASVKLIGLRLAPYWICSTDAGLCESDVECLVYFETLILEIQINFTQIQRECTVLS